jgi:ketosteroid isomerase-like protein
MTDWRVQLVRDSYAAFHGLDVDALLPLYDPDCEWHTGTASAALGQATYRGHDGLRALVADLREVFPDWHPRILESRLREDGALLAHFNATSSGAMDGAGIDITGGQIVEFRNRCIVRVVQTDAEPPGWDTAEPAA